MKKILLPLIGLIFVFSQINAQSHHVVSNTDDQITFTVSTGELITSDITLEEGQFTRLLMAGYVSTTENVGKPELPMITKMIEIPICGNLHVSATAGRVRTLTAEEAGISHTVYPAQPQYPKSYTGDRPLQKDEVTYTTNESYGLPLATVSGAFIARDVNMATVTIHPVQVNPVTNTVTLYEDITVSVTCDNVDMAATQEMKMKYASPAFSRPTELINRIETGINRDVLSTRPVKMLIIAHDMFNGKLDSFVNWKRRKGFIVEIAYTSTTGTTTTAIKNYIAGKFANVTASDPAPTYVLLVGDVEQIPAHSGQTDSHYTDLYYYTQVGNDNVPDCYGGRFSAKNMTQLTAQVDKTLNYEQLNMPDLSYLDRCVLVAGTDRGYNGDYGYSLGNPTIHYMADSLAPEFYSTIDTYYNPHANSDDNTIRTKLSNGTGYANYTAHCSAEGWADPSFTTQDVPSMNNTNKYGLMIGNCCESNTFSEDECFGEALLRLANKGAIGYIGGSNSTLWYHDYYWAIGAHGSLESSCSNCNNVTYDANNLGAYDCLFHTHGETFPNWYVTQGSIIYAGNMAVQDAYGANDSDVKYYWEIYHLMGDPSVMPWLGRPADMNILVDGTAPINSTVELIDGTTSIAVSTGAPYSYVALTQNLTLITATMTDINGNATLTFPALNAGETYELAASAQNHRTTFTTINAVAGEGARVVITGVNVTDEAPAVANAHLTLDVTIENRFPEAAANTSISATTASDKITLTDATETVGTVNSGESRTLTASFELNVRNAISDGDIAPIEFTVSYLSQGNAETTTYTFNLVLVDARLAYVSDSHAVVEGNNDGIIDPGETVTITIVDENVGHIAAQDVVSELSTYYDLTPVTNSTINIGSVDAQAQCTSNFTVSIADNVPNGTLVPFFHHIYSTTNAALARTDTVWIFVGEVTATETWETGDMSQFGWTSNNYPWTVVNTGAQSGTYCAQSGNAGADLSTSELKLVINAQTDGVVSYYSKVSSENRYDYFRFYIDGIQKEQRSGEGAWRLSTWPIEAGEHTLTFTFEKDNYYASGSDCAWVDNITFPGSGEIAPDPRVLEDVSHSVVIISGNDDEDINQGETVRVDVTTRNIGHTNANNAVSELTTESSYATVLNGRQNIGIIVPNASVNSQFDIEIASDVPDQTVIEFVHTMYSDEDTCTMTFSFDIVVIGNEEGISENGPSTVTIYPNPTTTNVTVSLGDGIKATHIRLFNTFGQLISTTDITNSSAVINLSQLPNGIYFIQIYNNQALFTTGKVVKK